MRFLGPPRKSTRKIEHWTVGPKQGMYDATLIRNCPVRQRADDFLVARRQMARVILVNPSLTTVGYSFITPRWLFVLAQATPVNLVGDPILIDEAIEHFDPEKVQAGDIVGISISSGNCMPGYRVLKEAKAKGAIVVMGGIHTTIFPDEPLSM